MNKEANNKIILYSTEDGKTEIEVNLEGETVWLSQKQMAELFQKDRKTITEHIRNVFKEGELEENSVCRKFQHTALDGKIYAVNFLKLSFRICEILHPHLLDFFGQSFTDDFQIAFWDFDFQNAFFNFSRKGEGQSWH